MENTNNKLSASEAVYGLLGWLTSRAEVVTFSAKNDAAIAATLADDFCVANGLDRPSEDWQRKLVHPEKAANGRIKYPNFVLSEDHLRALTDCMLGKGLDVYGYYDAKLFREIETNRPNMIQIVEAKNAPEGNEKQPYFGVILTDEGEKILQTLIK